jgi:hypothetical protein
MDHDQARKLEDEIGKAIAQVFRRLSKSRAIPKPKSDGATVTLTKGKRSG